MNPLVKKEIRLLLPSFSIGVALTFANFFLKENQSEFNVFVSAVSFASCLAIAVFMALNSFGAEISAGTFSLLLAQPVSRHRIWRTKTLLLAAALFIGGILWCITLYLRFEVFSYPKNLGDFWDTVLGVWLFLLVIYSGALWTVLLLRQTAAAFWFTLIVPGVFSTISWLFLQKASGVVIESVVIIVLTAYSVTGFIFARWLFLRAQDAQWTGGVITMPEVRGRAWFKIGSSVRRIRRPLSALFAKELQLHQSQLMIAGGLALLHLGVIATRKFGHFPQNSPLGFVLEQFWLLWLVMPLLVGCAAVAEERNMGTLEGQLCLPVKRCRQFTVKLFVVLLLSILFGTVMPLLLEGNKIVPGTPFVINAVSEYFIPLSVGIFWQTTAYLLFDFLNLVFVWMPVFILAGISTSFAAISFYASTLARNTLQTLAPAVLGILTTCFLLTIAYLPQEFMGYPLWRGPLFYPIGLSIMVFVLTKLAFWNFKCVFVGWGVLRRNLLTLVISLVLAMMATTALYHRAWEKLTPFEPPHGTARLSLSSPVVLRQQWFTLSVRLPDGRIWTDDYILDAGMPISFGLVLGNNRLTSLGGGYFLNGSNWITMVSIIRHQQVGIKTDGTLWVSEKPMRYYQLATGGLAMSKVEKLMQFGSETNWSSVIRNDLSVLLVKNDGTLWRWGTTNSNLKYEKWPDLQSFTPYRLGRESNWAEVFLPDYQPCFRKTDGSIWTLWVDHHKPKIEIEPGFFMQRSSFSSRNKWRGKIQIWGNSNYQLGVRDDGTFRIMAELQLNNQSRDWEWAEMDLQFGKDTNWLAVASHGEKVVTLKNDGSLWLWNFHRDYRNVWHPGYNEREMLDVKPVRLGTHSDWIGITDADGGIISLATDGSLWYWPLEDRTYYMSETGLVRLFKENDNNSFEPLLDISRKPEFLGNVFDKSD
jgi:ABC-type Na+ efflux pump permease subunit